MIYRIEARRTIEQSRREGACTQKHRELSGSMMNHGS